MFLPQTLGYSRSIQTSASKDIAGLKVKRISIKTCEDQLLGWPLHRHPSWPAFWTLVRAFERHQNLWGSASGSASAPLLTSPPILAQIMMANTWESEVLTWDESATHREKKERTHGGGRSWVGLLCPAQEWVVQSFSKLELKRAGVGVNCKTDKGRNPGNPSQEQSK